MTLDNKILTDWSDCQMLCILGPTASGKTRFAVEVARRVNSLSERGELNYSGAEILSADSRQVYRGMTLGTGKDLEEYGEIPYHLIDIADAGEKYNLFRYQRDFYKAYNETVARGAFPILCGGSGLYIEAVCKNYPLKEVAPDPKLRSRLESQGMEQLIKMLTDLKAQNGTAPHNNTDFDTRKRVIRAIEIERAVLQEKAASFSTSANCASSTPCQPEAPVKVKFVGLNPPREVRNARIDKRLAERLAAGMVEEVKGLLESGIAPADLIYYGLEYKFITQYLTGEISYAYMAEHLAIAIHQFAKRQMTWFRGMERRGTPIEWIAPEQYT